MVESITGIGSCRIVTPLRQGTIRRHLRFNQVRNYGFVHSTAEAVQQIRFMLDKQIPSCKIWPLISPKAQLAALLQKQHHISDMYVVEISSLKIITCCNHVLQLNYFHSAFPGIAGNSDSKQKFWSLADAGSQDDIDAFLHKLVSDGSIDRDDAKILRQVRLSHMTVEEMRTDLRWIIDNLPRVIFQTHVDAGLPDGKVFPDRRRLINAVKHAVSAEGGAVYDPTDLMMAWGQDKAMEHNSTAHWTEAFSNALFDDLWEKHLCHEPDCA